MPKENTVDADKQAEMLRIYQVAVNRIDDYFEYRMQSEQDKKAVQAILEDLTDSLTVIERRGAIG